MGILETGRAIVEEVTRKVAESESINTVKNVFGFVGAKGGLGTSTIVASVASILANNDYTIGLIDFDLHYPSLHRFLVSPSKEKNLISISNKFMDASLDTQELFNDTLKRNIKLVTAATKDSVPTYFDLSETTINSVITDMRALFDFVIIDFGGVDVAYESLTVGSKQCDTIFAVLAPYNGIAVATYKEMHFLSGHKYIAEKKTKVIQNLVVDKPLSRSVLDGYSMETLTVLPFLREVILYGYTDRLLINTTVEGKLADIYRNGIKEIAEYLCMVSDASSYTLDQDYEEMEVTGVAKVPDDEVAEETIDDLEETDGELDISGIDWDAFTKG